MVMKAGASYRDKNRIRKLYLAGRSVEQISAITSVRIEHVSVIIEQIKTGTLKLNSAGSTTGGGGYGEGEEDTETPQIEQGAAEHKVAEQHEAEKKALQDQIDALKERNAELEESEAEADEDDEAA